MFRRKKALVGFGYFIALLAVGLLAAGLIMWARIKNVQAKSSTEIMVNEQSNLIDSYRILHIFAEQSRGILLEDYWKNMVPEPYSKLGIAPSYVAEHYDRLADSAGGYFSEKYGSRNAEWKLDIEDMPGNKKNSIRSPNYFKETKSQWSVYTIFPVPKSYLKLTLTVREV